MDGPVCLNIYPMKDIQILNSCSCETDPETTVDLKLNVNHLCGVAAKETNIILGHVKRSIILRTGEGAFPPGSD